MALVHLLKSASGKERITKCGIHIVKPGSNIQTTIWSSEVNCPMCEPGSTDNHYLVFQVGKKK